VPHYITLLLPVQAASHGRLGKLFVVSLSVPLWFSVLFALARAFAMAVSSGFLPTRNIFFDFFAELACKE
jgi:hypothetical protein